MTEMVVVPFAPKTIIGAARNLDELIRILQSELTTAGFSPKPETDAAGNSFRLKAGFGALAKVYYRAVGDDVILTPEARASMGWLLFLLCCFLGCIPGLIGIYIRDRNVKKVTRRLPTVLEATNSSYIARFPPSAPAYPPLAPRPPAPPPPEALRAKKYCAYCGAEMRVEAVYCPRCGKQQ